ncbi:hypothetical protein FB451DRAFT_1528928 [Mycena latifolia]|nr:hypothetical protein FB451DRAFT_1528928 [Mycena latifolia]
MAFLKPMFRNLCFLICISTRFKNSWATGASFDSRNGELGHSKHQLLPPFSLQNLALRWLPVPLTAKPIRLNVARTDRTRETPPLAVERGRGGDARGRASTRWDFGFAPRTQCKPQGGVRVSAGAFLVRAPAETRGIDLEADSGRDFRAGYPGDAGVSSRAPSLREGSRSQY